MNSKIQKAKEVLDSIQSSQKEDPSRKESTEHAAVMDEQIAHVQEVNTPLKATVKGYKFSESS